MDLLINIKAFFFFFAPSGGTAARAGGTAARVARWLGTGSTAARGGWHGGSGLVARRLRVKP